MNRKLVFLLLLVATCVSGHSQSIPNSLPCTTGRALDGSPVITRQVVGFSQAWAQTSWQGGFPIITYGEMYFRLPPLIQRFTSIHECGHASTGNPNEFAANCFALKHGGFSDSDIQEIGVFYESLPGNYPPQYGGSGRAFWEGTVEMCPELVSTSNSERSHQSESVVNGKDLQEVLETLISASLERNGFLSIRGTPSGVIDGEMNWDANIAVGTNKACSVFAGRRSEDMEPRVDCDLAGLDVDPDDAASIYRSAIRTVRDALSSKATFNEMEFGKTQEFIAKGSGFEVDIRFTQGNHITKLVVEVNQS
jgi:hypothetical protein